MNLSEIDYVTTLHKDEKYKAIPDKTLKIGKANFKCK